MFVTVGKAGPPRPTDPFVLAIREAMAKEADAAAAQAAVKGLAEVYAAGAKFADDQTVAKWGDLFNRMAKEANDRKLGGKVPGVQAVVQAELKKKLVGADGTPVKMDADLADAGRAKAATELSRVAAALAAAN